MVEHNHPARLFEVLTSLPNPCILEQQLKQEGLELIETNIPSEPLMPLAEYLNKEGPFDINYCKCDSTWAFADEEELAAGLKWWRSMLDRSEADAFMATQE